MKIVHLSNSDGVAGSGIAARRIVAAQRRAKLDSELWVRNKTTELDFVYGSEGGLAKIKTLIRPKTMLPLQKISQNTSEALTSFAMLPSQFHKSINKKTLDVVNLHWVQHEMLSLSDIAKFKAPIVWTMHDMWLACGSEHLLNEENFFLRYANSSAPKLGQVSLLNLITWYRKTKVISKDSPIVCPSRWMKKIASESQLLNRNPIVVIPNSISTDFWKPIDKSLARELLGLPRTAKIIGYGCAGSAALPYKGGDLLKESLRKMNSRYQKRDVFLATFGPGGGKFFANTDIRSHHFGQMNDPLSLRVFYSAIDVLAVPSRLDNLPNCGVEAISCGTPVVGFTVGGMVDIVDHAQNGFLAKPYDTTGLAHYLERALDSADEMSLACLDKAKRVFSEDVVAKKYNELYQSLS